MSRDEKVGAKKRWKGNIPVEEEIGAMSRVEER